MNEDGYFFRSDFCRSVAEDEQHRIDDITFTAAIGADYTGETLKMAPKVEKSISRAINNYPKQNKIYLIEGSNDDFTSVTFEIFINDMCYYEPRSCTFVRTDWRWSWWNVNIVDTNSSFLVIREFVTVRYIAFIVRLLGYTFTFIDSGFFTSSSRIIVRFIFLNNEI